MASLLTSASLTAQNLIGSFLGVWRVRMYLILFMSQIMALPSCTNDGSSVVNRKHQAHPQVKRRGTHLCPADDKGPALTRRNACDRRGVTPERRLSLHGYVSPPDTVTLDAHAPDRQDPGIRYRHKQGRGGEDSLNNRDSLDEVYELSHGQRYGHEASHRDGMEELSLTL